MSTLSRASSSFPGTALLKTKPLVAIQSSPQGWEGLKSSSCSTLPSGIPGIPGCTASLLDI